MVLLWHVPLHLTLGHSLFYAHIQQCACSHGVEGILWTSVITRAGWVVTLMHIVCF